MIEPIEAPDEAKFFTQKVVTYALLLIYASVTAYVFWGEDQAERSTVLQTVITFTTLAIGFWLGSSKGSADKQDRLDQLLVPQGAQAAALAANTAAVAVNTEAMTKDTKDKP